VIARLRSQGGFTMIPAIVTMSLILAVGGAALAMAWRSIATSQKDRSAERAMAAADSGADVAGYRMNKTIVGAGSAGLLGFTTDALHTLACTQVSAGSWTVVTGPSNNGGFCTTSPEESLGDGSSFHYTMSLGVHLGAGASDILVRRVVSTGTSGTVTRRILVTYKLDLTTGSAIRLFKRWRYAVCSTTPPTSDPSSGCPDPGT
jgi:type II secretory pathway pseudopilin PulG